MLKNLQCDICSKQIQSKFLLSTLREKYQTEDIVQICEDCEYIINKRLQRLQNKCWSGEIKIEDISKELKGFMVKWKAWEKRYC
jgi:hypothetical protein